MTLPPPSSGGGRLVIESRQSGRRSVQAMEFDERGHVRITHEDDGSFGLLLMPDGMPYFFGHLSGRAVAVDLVAGLAKAGGASPHATQSEAPFGDRVAALDPMGSPHVVAGIGGESFRVEWRDVDGGHRHEEIVLTRDPRLSLCVKTLAAALCHDTGIRSHDTRLDRMVERGWFALAAEGYRVIGAQFDSPPSAAGFELDAVPGDDLRVMFQVVIEAARGRVLDHAPSSGTGPAAGRPQ